MLTMYVDDFLLSGPSENLSEGWNLIRYDQSDSTPKGHKNEVIQMDEPTAIGKYLGAEHVLSTSVAKDGTRIQHCHWDMSGYMQQCVDLYTECVQKHGNAAALLNKMKHADTPFS